MQVEAEPVQQVGDFMYLGATISGNGTIERDLDLRIQSANGAFHQIGHSRTIKALTEIRIYKAAVLLSLSYCMKPRSGTQPRNR